MGELRVRSELLTEETMLRFTRALASVSQPFRHQLVRASSGAVENLASAQEVIGTKGSTAAKVLSIGSLDTLQKCVDEMRSKNVGALVITDTSNPKEIAGIITERDVVKCMADAGEKQAHDNLMQSVQTYMTRASKLKMVNSHAPLDECIEMMSKHKIRHLLVMKSSPSTDLRQLDGVMSMKDALNAVLQGYMCKSCWFKEEELLAIQERVGYSE